MKGLSLPMTVRRQSFWCVAEGLDVGEILRTPGGALVSQEALPADERHGVRAQRSLFSGRPHVVPVDAVDRAHHVDLHGRDAHLDDLLASDNVRRGQGRGGKTEVGDSCEEPTAVLLCRPDQDVEVTSEAGRAVESQGMRPTITNSTLRALNNAQNSLKSGARSNELSPQEFNGRDTLGRGLGLAGPGARGWSASPR